VRALFVIPGPALHGAERALIDAGAALTARGYFPMVGTETGGDVARFADHRGVEMVPIPGRQSRVGRAAALRTLVARRAVDAIFVATDADFLSAALAARWCGRGVVVRRMGAGEPQNNPWGRRLARRLARSGVLTTTATDNPLGVRVPECAASVGDTDLPRLTCVSGFRDGERRALADVLRAFALLRNRFPTLRLVVVGDHDSTMDTSARLHAAALRVSEGVDWVSDPLLRQDAIGRSTLGFVAADGDDGVYGVLDLMAHGVPFVARRTSLVERYVGNGIHGVLLPTLEAPRAASELAVMLSSPARREAMGNASRIRAARDFTDEMMAQPFDAIVRQLHGQAS